MNLEWIIGGIALLIAVIVGKKVGERSAFQCLVRTFTVVWAALAALHFWPLILGVVEDFIPSLDLSYQSLIAFWGGFVVACIPCAVLMGAWLGNYSTTFPSAIDGIIQYVGGMVSAVAVLCLLIMSAGVYGYPDEFNAERYYLRIDQFPLTAYTYSASAFSANQTQKDFEFRLPIAATNLFKNPAYFSDEEKQGEEETEGQAE